MKYGCTLIYVEACTNKTVKSGAELIAKPTQKPLGQRVGYVRLIEGILIEIYSPMGR